MDKQNVLYLYNGQLFGNGKEWNANAGYAMDKSWKHIKRKKPDTKCHMLYDSIFMKCPE